MELERSKKESFKQKRKHLESIYETDENNNLNIVSKEETGFGGEITEEVVDEEDEIDFSCEEQLFQYDGNELHLDNETEKCIENHLIIQDDACIRERPLGKYRLESAVTQSSFWNRFSSSLTRFFVN